jgi:biopolymer transport protein ExbB
MLRSMARAARYQPRTTALSAVLFVMAIAPSAIAQEGPAATQRNSDTPTTKKQLQATLDRLNQTIEQERQALDQSQKSWQDQREAAKAKRDELAGKLLQAERQSQEAGEKAAQLDQSLKQTQNQADRLTRTARKLRSEARKTAEQISVHLQQVPASNATSDQVKNILSRLNTTSDEQDVPKTGDPNNGASQPTVREAIGNLLTLIDQTHDQATRLHLRETKLWTATGQRETVDLLSVGHVAFAYRTKNDQRLGLALASPEQATGFRWSEALPKRHRRALDTAINQLQNPRAASAEQAAFVPMDVTGRLTAEAVTPGEGWLASLGAGGIIMVPLLAVAGFGVLLAMERFVCLYLANGQAGRSVAHILSAARQDDVKTAESHAQRARGAVARTLRACLDRRPHGQHAMEDAIQEQLLHETPRLQRFLGGIAILAAIAPLLGLLGTVTGIIETFGVIRAFGQTDPGLMAGGISQALVTTAAGLIIAIPLLLAHAVLRGRVNRIIAEAEKQAATLLNILAHDDTTQNDERTV